MSVRCRESPSDDDPKHVSCAPSNFVSPIAWDGIDNSVFRPLSNVFAFRDPHESVNVNSMDEVPDSAWFTNRSDALTAAELMRGACEPSQMLRPDEAADGSWLIDKGKLDGASPGFRIKTADGAKYLLKSDAPVFERPSAASVIGAAIYHAAGFNTSCEQIVYIRRSLLKLKEGLEFAGNFSAAQDFDEKVLDGIIEKTPQRDGLVRFQASAWLSGLPIGPFRYEGTRWDDPSDVVPHQDRRELRGGRLLAAWINHFDARAQNSMDVWMADRKDRPDSSPGKVLHYYIDTSDSLGSEWAWDDISRRLGNSYLLDWGDIGYDFVTFGIPVRPWEKAQRAKGHEIFGYFDAAHFVPEDWKMEYPNAAFSDMTERDGAWMARILSRFTPELVNALATMGKFSDPSNTTYIAGILELRLQAILNRYLTRLSPVSEAHLEGAKLCAVNLAERRALRPSAAYRYTARTDDDKSPPVERRGAGALCVPLPAGAPRYFAVTIHDGVAKGPLVVHLYALDSGTAQIAGLERPYP